MVAHRQAAMEIVVEIAEEPGTEMDNGDGGGMSRR